MADIRLITKNTDLSHPPKPYDWDVLIDGRPYFVVRMEGYVHSIGGRWGNNDLWAYPRDEAPSYENLIEFSADQPVAWGLQYKPNNYTKTKWDETEARSGGGVTITRNGRPFCHIAGGLNYGIDKARTMIMEFSEHPLELNAICQRESDDVISRSALLKAVGDPDDGMVWPTKHGVVDLIKNAPAAN